MGQKPATPAIEDIVDRAHARLLHRTGREPGALSVYEDDRYRWLENDDGTLQSVMDRRAPERLVLPYTAAMMAGLWFVDSPRSILILGLGGGSQVRFLRHHFVDAHVTAWESDPAVIDIARCHFYLPDEDEGMRVLNDDARKGIADDDLPADLILLDAFGAGGLPAWVRHKNIHEHCRRRLADHGVLVTNFWVDADDEFLEVMNGVQKVFEKCTLVLPVPGYRNFVVLAFKTMPRLDFAGLRERADDLGRRTGLDYVDMLKRLRESNLSDETGFVF